jgi:hypothetical protein
MKRLALAAVLAGCTLITASVGAQADARYQHLHSKAQRQGSGSLGQGIAKVKPSDTLLCKGWQYRIEKGMSYETIVRRVKRVILCAFTVHGNPNQVLTAWYVADRESNFLPWAYNPSGASGLFQHMAGYWSGRRMLLPKAQFPNRAKVSPFNARANAWVTAIMVGGGNWGPWSM